MVLSNDVRYLTVQEFSQKTGLAPSTLRFYDRKKLLIPECRLPNGYRGYAAEQIDQALMIHSLRCADIPIADIKLFLSADVEAREHLIVKWRKDVEVKLSSLRIAEQYLGGLIPKENHFYLTRWEESTTFVWFKHVVPRQEHPFEEMMKRDLALIRAWGNKFSPDIYVRTLDSKNGTMEGEIGFIVDSSKVQIPEDFTDVYVQTLPPTLFATLACSTTDPFICFYFIQMIKQYGLQPEGIQIERYESPMASTLVYLIPLTKIK
jgi:DNA-binding transcriptional MerR regulator